MSVSQPAQHFILLDNPDLYMGVNRILGSNEGRTLMGTRTRRLATGHTGFANVRRYEIGPAAWDIICLPPAEDAQLFAFYVMGQGTLRGKSLAISISQARALRRDLAPGDLAIVNEAVALPFPARYQDVTTLSDDYHDPVFYTADPNCLDLMPESETTATWQKRIPVIRTGYFKHPTLNGALEPWEARHLETLKDHKVDTLSYMPAGVFDARRLFPDLQTLCLNMITGTEANSVSPEWKRHKSTLLFPAVQMILAVITRQLQANAT